MKEGIPSQKPQNPNEIKWTLRKLENFMRVYKINRNEATFMFEGYEFVPAYAKYLIDYLKKELL